MGKHYQHLEKGIVSNDARKCSHCKGNQYLHSSRCWWNVMKEDEDIHRMFPEATDSVNRVLAHLSWMWQVNTINEKKFFKLYKRAMKGRQHQGKKWFKRATRCVACKYEPNSDETLTKDTDINVVSDTN